MLTIINACFAKEEFGIVGNHSQTITELRTHVAENNFIGSYTIATSYMLDLCKCQVCNH